MTIELIRGRYYRLICYDNLIVVAANSHCFMFFPNGHSHEIHDSDRPKFLSKIEEIFYVNQRTSV